MNACILIFIGIIICNYLSLHKNFTAVYPALTRYTSSWLRVHLGRTRAPHRRMLTSAVRLECEMFPNRLTSLNTWSPACSAVEKKTEASEVESTYRKWVTRSGPPEMGFGTYSPASLPSLSLLADWRYNVSATSSFCHCAFSAMMKWDDRKAKMKPFLP